MHRARDSRGRFIARAKSSIFTTPSSSRHRQDSPTSTPSLKVPGIQGVAELEDSPTPSTKSHLKEDPFFTSTGEHIVIQEVESPEEEKEETPSHPPFIEELEDPEDLEEIIMTEVVDGFGGRGRGREGGNNGRGNGGGRGNNGGNRDGDNSFGFPIADEETHTTMKNISPFVLPNFHGLRSEDPETFLFEF